jgi:predicted dehydrogenase
MKHWKACPYTGCKILAAWDDNSRRGQALADRFTCQYYSDLDAFLANPAIDAVIICSPTSQHAEHIIRAAIAGKHIYVEKSPFTSLEGAYLAREAVKKSGVHFMVSSPMEKPRVRFAKRFIDEGKLGVINEIRFRLTNDGAIDRTEPTSIYNKEENGGGAMIDFGQHGVHILNWFLGMPVRTSARFGYVTDFAKKYRIEDNAVALYEFESGAIGVVEAGWASPYHECFLDIFGTKGRLHVVGDDVLYTPDGTKKIFDDVSYELGGKNPVHVPESDLPEPFLFPLRHWIETIINDTPDDRQNIDEAVAWTEMLVAAYRAAECGEKIL